MSYEGRHPDTEGAVSEGRSLRHPTFQRPYVWNQEDQWDPLWDDVRNVAEDYLDHLRSVGPDERARAEAKTGAHFLGAVVVQQQSTAAAEIETRRVVDGQQRLTTLQLLVDAAQEVVERLGWSKEAKRLSRLVLNDEDYAEANPDDVFKIWPTTVDQDPFRSAMTNGMASEGLADSLIVQGHEFFQLQISQWLEEKPDDQELRVHALEAALMGLLEMVVIDLGAFDDAHVIFETLNARGTPLLASDLVKNFVLQSIAQRELDADAIYQEHWLAFDRAWWRDEVRQGRLVRPRIDVFLNYWLIMRNGIEVSSDDVFASFRRRVEVSGHSVEDVVVDLHKVGASYRQFEDYDPFTPEGTFFYRWQVMDAGVSTPLLLWLFSRSEAIPPDHLHRGLAAIESFLIRRMLCRMTTKDYNKLFVELISELESVGDPVNADGTIIAYFAKQTADARLWPDDYRLKEALRDLPLYRLLTRRRLRMVLEALEESLRTSKAEEAQVTREKLTVEHLMPQAWREHWSLPRSGGVDDEETAAVRDRLVHSIGNLTLVNKKLNPALSNAAWAEKQDGIAKHSVLFLNKAVLDQARDGWDEATIRVRADRLHELTASKWPAARALLADATP